MMAEDSDCDSGAFSRCSTPGLLFHPSEHPLMSPPLVLSVLRSSSGCRSRMMQNEGKLNGAMARPRANPRLLLSCLREAGRSSCFSSLQNISRQHPSKTVSRVMIEEERVRALGFSPQKSRGSGLGPCQGSLPDICDGSPRAWSGAGWTLSPITSSRPDSTLSWWWDNEFSDSGTGTGSGDSGPEDIRDLRLWGKQRPHLKGAHFNNCSALCTSQVTVNGEHICCFA